MQSNSSHENTSDAHAAPEFWFNTKTLKVERGLLTAAPYRIGPFRTEDEAKNALEIIRNRAAEWQKDDEASA